MGKLASHEALKGKSTKRSVGAYGAKRDTPARSAKQVTRRENRLQEARVRDALAEARAQEAALEHLVVPDADKPALGAQFGAISKAALGQLDLKEHQTTAWRHDQLMRGEHCPMCGTTFSDCDKKQHDAERPCCRHCSTEGEEVAHDIKPVERKILHRFEPWEGDGKNGYTIAQARRMLDDGYHVEAVMRRTGIGFKWLDDRTGRDGYVKGLR